MPERRSTKSPAVGGAGEEGLSCRMLPSDFYINSGFTSAVPDFHVGSALALLDNDLIPIASSAANCCIRFAHAVFSASRTDTGLVTDLDGACRDRNQRGARERDRECQCLCCSHLFLLLINPIFGASVRYQPVEATTLSLTASRTVNASYFESQIIVATSIGAGLEQRLFKHFYLRLSGGYTSSSYISTETGTATTRTDNGFYFGTSLSCIFLKRGSFSVFYNYNENSSSAGNFSFASTQIGCEIGYRY